MSIEMTYTNKIKDKYNNTENCNTQTINNVNHQKNLGSTQNKNKVPSHQTSLVMHGHPTSSLVKLVMRNIQAMFGFIPISLNIKMFVCRCNHVPLLLFAVLNIHWFIQIKTLVFVAQ